MKKGVKLVIGLLILLIVILSSLTNVFSNVWHVMTAQGFIIPKESSVFSFTVTKVNEGSGEWWLYAEDEYYYYTMEQTGTSSSYLKIAKETTEQLEHFDKHNYKTWVME
ncbi:MAG: hypothetical protein O9262_08845 [Cyclobacteriaceae bacterium]|nr:hypothetical protein [Cyclobacteriaceae bacterium]